MTNAGDYSPEQLATLVVDAQSRVRNCRRRELSGLIADIDSLASTISAELQLDEDVLAQEKARYREQFSLFERMNPFHLERQQTHERRVKPVDEEVRQDRQLLQKCCELLEWVRNASQPIEWRHELGWRRCGCIP